MLRTLLLLPALVLLALGLLAIAAMLGTLAQLPQALTLAVILVGVIVWLMLAIRPWGADRMLSWLADRPYGQVPRYRPLQIAALAVACAVSALERAPAWIAAELPRARAQWADAVARDGAALGTLTTALVYLVVLGIVAFLALAALVMVLDAFGVGRAQPWSHRFAASTSVLWTALSTAFLVAAEVPRLLGQDTGGPRDPRWWLALTFALGITRNVHATVLVFGYDHFRLEEPLVRARLPGRTAPSLAALGLVAAALAHLALEHWLGFVAAIALVVVGSGPLAYSLEKATPRDR